MDSRGIVLDRRSLVVPATDMLTVYRPGRTRTIRGRNVDVAYGRLEPYLDGTHHEEELLAGLAPRHATAMQSLLGSLRRLGALVDVRGQPMRILLDTSACAVPDDESAVIAFVDLQSASEWLLTLENDDDLRNRLRCLVLLSDGCAVGPAAHDRRARYARWLSGTLFDRMPHQRRLWIFRLFEEDGTLTLLAKVGGDDAPLDTLARQLQVVRAADADQLPLVVATASHELLPAAITGYGLRFEELEFALSTELLVSAQARTADVLVADSRPAVEALAAERAASARWRSGELSWEEVDALSVDHSHPDVAYLQRVLRLRRRTLPVLRAMSPGAMVFLRSPANGVSAVSLVAEKALFDLLLETVWQECYGCEPGRQSMRVSRHSSFTTPDDLERRLRLFHRQAPGDDLPPNTSARSVSIWGLKVWRADLPGPTEGVC